MYEYRVADGNSTNTTFKPPTNDKTASLRLDDWVLCRIYKKTNCQQRPMDHLLDKEDSSIDEMLFISSSSRQNYTGLLETPEESNRNFFDRILSHQPTLSIVLPSEDHKRPHPSSSTSHEFWMETNEFKKSNGGEEEQENEVGDQGPPWEVGHLCRC
ncbi:hypothetical protein QQ045_010901 [Rhodiola kirilowii]